jgi:cytoskeletal protein CcmA (bactofilin family)
MNLIDELWPEDDTRSASQGKVAMAELFNAETESNVTPISATELLSTPAPEPSARVQPVGYRSVSDFENEFKNYGSQTSVPETVSNEPASTPEIFSAPKPVVAPEPVVVPEAVVASEPVVVPEAVAAPEPVAAPQSTAMPEVIAASVSHTSEFAPAVEPELKPVSAPAPIPAEASPVPNAIAEEAEAEAKEIEERKLALAAAQMGVAQADLNSAAGGGEQEAEEEPIEQGISVITREATVLGDIITQGHIDIVGRVKGNIDAKGDVAIHGIVRGDVGGSKIGLYDCRVKGNLDAGLGVIVDESSIIGGDVKTKNIIFDGKVKGNIDAENVVVLRSHSLTLGDVSAASLAVEPGAILNGTVKTLVDGDLEAPFEEVL